MKGTSASRYALILIPTAFDLAATALMSVGLLYVTVSVYQMMRGTEIIFSALLSTAFLRRDLNRQHVVGIMLCTVRTMLSMPEQQAFHAWAAPALLLQAVLQAADAWNASPRPLLASPCREGGAHIFKQLTRLLSKQKLRGISGYCVEIPGICSMLAPPPPSTPPSPSQLALPYRQQRQCRRPRLW